MALATGWKLARAEWLAGAIEVVPTNPLIPRPKGALPLVGTLGRVGSTLIARRTSPLYTDFRKTPPLRFISARASFHPVAKRTDAKRTCAPGEER